MLAMDFIKTNRETAERAIRDKGVDLGRFSDPLPAFDRDKAAAGGWRLRRLAQFQLPQIM